MHQDQCMDMVQPLLALWHDGWHASHSKYLSYPSDVSADHDDATAAACIRCQMWNWTQVHMSGVSGVNFVMAGDTKQLPVMNYLDRAVIRFKKVDASGRHANYPTDQQEDFDRNRPLPGIPPKAIRLTCGYEPAPTGDIIRRIIESELYGSSILWASQVNVIEDIATWEDITPVRFPGTTRIQDRPRRAAG